MPTAPEPFTTSPATPAPLQLGPSPIAVARKVLASRAASEAVVMSPAPRLSPTSGGSGGLGLKPRPTHPQNGPQQLQQTRVGTHSKLQHCSPLNLQQSGDRRQLRCSSSGDQRGVQQEQEGGSVHAHSGKEQGGYCRELQRSSSWEAPSCLGSFELIELQGRGLDAAHAGSPVLRTRPPPLSREEWATFFSPSDGEYPPSSVPFQSI